MNTVSLVNSVEDLLHDIDEYKISTIPYGKIFVVFDKDSFTPEAFNQAIIMCEKSGIFPYGQIKRLNIGSCYIFTILM